MTESSNSVNMEKLYVKCFKARTSLLMVFKLVKYTTEPINVSKDKYLTCIFTVKIKRETRINS